MLCSICVSTYKRPILLKKLLNSLASQSLDSEVSLEIIVVDNDPEKQAEKVVREFQQNASIVFKYFEQPIKNISLTRNKAVAEAKGEYILFIDDDGYADKSWISEMINCIIYYNADAVFGTVLPYFDDEAPDWIKNSHFFDRVIQKTGETSSFTRTGNCIIKSKLIKYIDGPFAPEFGLTGGGDTDLFDRLSKAGAKFIYCAESIVYDLIPKERACLKWLAKRSYRTGINYTSRMISLSENKYLTSIYFLIKSILYAWISTFLFLFCIPSRVWRSHWFLKIISNLGHIAGVFNIKYEVYNI